MAHCVGQRGGRGVAVGGSCRKEVGIVNMTFCIRAAATRQSGGRESRASYPVATLGPSRHLLMGGMRFHKTDLARDQGLNIITAC